MGRLIDADEVLIKLWNKKYNDPNDAIEVAKIINEAPTIKALDQDLYLCNKIRAEIENHCGLPKKNHYRYCSYCNSVMTIREILEIIDEYKSESEG